eukprot:g1272.t1
MFPFQLVGDLFSEMVLADFHLNDWQFWLVLVLDVALLIMRDADLWDDAADFVRRNFLPAHQQRLVEFLLLAQLIAGDSDDIGERIKSRQNSDARVRRLDEDESEKLLPENIEAASWSKQLVVEHLQKLKLAKDYCDVVERSNVTLRSLLTLKRMRDYEASQELKDWGFSVGGDRMAVVDSLKTLTDVTEEEPPPPVEDAKPMRDHSQNLTVKQEATISRAHSHKLPTKKEKAQVKRELTENCVVTELLSTSILIACLGLHIVLDNIGVKGNPSFNDLTHEGRVRSIKLYLVIMAAQIAGICVSHQIIKHKNGVEEEKMAAATAADARDESRVSIASQARRRRVSSISQDSIVMSDEFRRFRFYVAVSTATACLWAANLVNEYLSGYKRVNLE